MKCLVLLVFVMLLFPAVYAAGECRDADGNVADQSACEEKSNSNGNASALPEDVMVVVTDMDAKMRFFTAVGFHDKSKEKRDEITAIYAEHGVALPDQYKD